MDLLPLVVLLCSCLHPPLVSSQEDFYIYAVNLSVEPSTNVSRDTNVTLRCKAKVLSSRSGQTALTREYTIYKDRSIIYTKTSVSSDDLLYLLPHARVSNSGRYQCSVKIRDTLRKSEVKKLTVRGLSTPVLRVDKDVVSEGEEITAWCSAPGETGSISFYFYNNYTDMVDKYENSDQAEVKVHLRSVGLHQITCRYTVRLLTDFGLKDSEVSNSVMVTVRELPFKPVLVVTPDHQVFEGDPLTVECTISGLQNSSGTVRVYLSQGSRLLGRGASRVNHTMTALVQKSEEFVCKLEFGFAKKEARKKVSVIAPVSVPRIWVEGMAILGWPVQVLCQSYSGSLPINYTLLRGYDPVDSVSVQRSSEKAVFTVSVSSAAELRSLMCEARNDPREAPLSRRLEATVVGLHLTLVSSQEVLDFDAVNLSVEPSTNVSRDTNVTLRCKAKVSRSRSGQTALTREYTIYKDRSIIYTKTSVSSDDLLYLLPHARVSNSGRYQCSVKIRDTLRESEVKKLTVRGLSTPVLRVDKDVVSEGEEITAWCSASGETGSILFLFYNNYTAVDGLEKSDQAEVKVHLPLLIVGLHQITCRYTVMLSPYTPGLKDSEVSNSVMVTVRELPFKPVLVVTPDHQVFEGDPLTVECTISSLQNSSRSVGLLLKQGSLILGRGASRVNHTMTALVQKSEEFVCTLEMGKIVKVVKKKVSVIELFSAPTLSMTPSEVSQKENMTLTCRSESFASQRLSREELIYSLVPPDHLLQRRDNGVFSGRALAYDFNYTCEARAKGLVKISPVLTVRPEDFYIDAVNLSVEPSTNVSRDTNVTLRCKAKVLSSRSGQTALTREYTIYKDRSIIYTNTSVSSDDLLYLLPHARVSNSGRYQCSVKIRDTLRESEDKTLTVRGLSTPVLRVDKDVVSEGEEITAWCSAPGETGSIFFYFYNNYTIVDHLDKSDQAEVKVHLPLLIVGQDQITCRYTVLSPYTPGSENSEVSNSVMVTVRELPFKPMLVVTPDHQVFEGDPLTVECTISGLQNSSGSVRVYLSQGSRLLGHGASRVNHTMTALVQKSEEFECTLEMEKMVKVVKKNVSVIELFSAPTLSMTPSEISQKENMTLTCRSESFASQRLSREELIYSLVPPDHLLQRRDNGVFFGRALAYDFNYTCEARAKGLVKLSPVLTVRPKDFIIDAVNLSVEPSTNVSRDTNVTLRCKAKVLSSRSGQTALTREYTIYKDRSIIYTKTSVSSDDLLYLLPHARVSNSGRYQCSVKIRDTLRESEDKTLTVRAPVSVPRIWVEGRAILGRPVKVLCQSYSGSLPINYTLLRGYDPVDSVSVQLSSEKAVFTVSVSSAAELSSLMCEARNDPREAPLSRRLEATVVEPLSEAILTVTPDPADISEGDHLFLICGVKGSPPITFKWYRSGQEEPLLATTVDMNHTDFQIQSLSKGDSDSYRCEALNDANSIHSQTVTIQVRLALWKKALIGGGVCVLVISVLVLAGVLWFRSKACYLNPNQQDLVPKVPMQITMSSIIDNNE